MTLLKGYEIVGVFMGAFSKREPSLNRANLDALLQLVEQGKLNPLVSKTFSIDEVPLALRQSRNAVGKLVIGISS